MKQYLETLKEYLQNTTSNTKRSELVEAWNTAIDSYNADDDVIEALEAYSTARATLANALKSCIKMEYEVEELGADCQRANEYCIVDCDNNFKSITHFDDADNMKKTRTGECTFDLLRRVFEPVIYELQSENGCPHLDPRNF